MKIRICRIGQGDETKWKVSGDYQRDIQRKGGSIILVRYTTSLESDRSTPDL